MESMQQQGKVIKSYGHIDETNRMLIGHGMLIVERPCDEFAGVLGDNAPGLDSRH